MASDSSDNKQPKKRTTKAGAKKATSKSRVYQRPRGGEAKAIADLMPEIGRTAFRRFGFVQSSVVTRWPEIAGERYAAISLPESIRFPKGEKSEGTLNLVVNGAHAVLMQHVGPEIIERVNRFFGYPAVAKIKFRQGDVTPPRSKPPVKPPRPLKPVPVELGDGLRDIGDPELLAVLESLASDIANAEEGAEANAKDGQSTPEPGKSAPKRNDG
ncbi:DUF721 domain-containing protein [Alterisphingorhabdus coralli]|uniref:DciA family protein n=1 Tax=Alterisphingorhabdus coralli TaxID=3071408 RepID=A0AA97F5Y2_9SPHN|nr:DciA family protein [Parasphingorhabdus sp. SCSIO 66989]WOE74984.1 DciA family protein [Parasphingorhabdus sp. SCSIO 66989]